MEQRSDAFLFYHCLWHYCHLSNLMTSTHLKWRGEIAAVLRIRPNTDFRIHFIFFLITTYKYTFLKICTKRKTHYSTWKNSKFKDRSKASTCQTEIILAEKLVQTPFSYNPTQKSSPQSQTLTLHPVARTCHYNAALHRRNKEPVNFQCIWKWSYEHHYIDSHTKYKCKTSHRIRMVTITFIPE